MIVSETIFTRIKVLKKYIAAVDEKVKAHDYHQAAAVVKHFKQADKKRVIECKPSIHKI